MRIESAFLSRSSLSSCEARSPPVGFGCQSSRAAFSNRLHRSKAPIRDPQDLGGRRRDRGRCEGSRCRAASEQCVRSLRGQRCNLAYSGPVDATHIRESLLNKLSTAPVCFYCQGFARTDLTNSPLDRREAGLLRAVAGVGSAVAPGANDPCRRGDSSSSRECAQLHHTSDDECRARGAQRDDPVDQVSSARDPRSGAI
jgi:hypothetical protein